MSKTKKLGRPASKVPLETLNLSIDRNIARTFRSQAALERRTLRSIMEASIVKYCQEYKQ